MDSGRGDIDREGPRERGEVEGRTSSRFESFEYNHQSHPNLGGGASESHDSKPQIFDYHHQSNRPPPWDMGTRPGPRPMPMPPPGFRPPPPFPPMDPKWGPGPPPPHGPHGAHGPPGPPVPPMIPPDLPPPIPYYDLPAGITCLLVPVSIHILLRLL